MIRSYLLVALLILAPLAIHASSATPTHTLSSAQLNDQALLTTLNNYFGCKVWAGNTCVQCSTNFFFNSAGVCCQVSPSCQQFNLKMGVCQRCYDGYSIVNGACSTVVNTDPTRIGCATWLNGACAKCSQRYFLASSGVCQPVSDQCSSWQQNGQCTECYKGYFLNNGGCSVDNSNTIVIANPFCKIWSARTCIQCADRTYFDSNGVCTAVSAQCQSFDKSSGACLGCFAGYTLANGVCSESSNQAPVDLGCSRWDWNNQKCLQCSQRWNFNNQGVCAPVSNDCATWANNACTGCYKGYGLINGVCVASGPSQPIDLGCATWDWNNQVCLQCSFGFVSNNGKCQQTSTQCKSNDQVGNCLTCYTGYTLSNGQCVLAPVQGPSDLGCAQWDWNNQVCLRCSNSFTFSNGKCVVVSDQCKTFNSNGWCLTCFTGYALNNGGQCVLAPVQGPTDLGCAQWDWNNQVCLRCSVNWVAVNGVCTSVSSQCSTWNSQGACTTCYQGYNLQNGACILAPVQGPTDLGCGKWDWNSQVCLSCSKGFFFNSQGSCIAVSSLCASWDNNGVCTNCYKGYNLQNGGCHLAPVQPPTDLGCGQWDWNNQACLKCSFGYTYGSNGLCVAVSSLCSSWNSNGACTACFVGYSLNSGSCVLSPLRGPTDLGCGQWDWNNQVCLKCSNGFVAGSNGVCTQVSSLCATWSAQGACTSCYKGYTNFNGVCSLSPLECPKDLGCGQWDWNNQVCLKCSFGFVFGSNGVCQSVSSQCSTWDSNGACTACFKGYNLQNGACVLAPQNGPSDLGCAQWDWNNQVCLKCSNGFVFGSNGVCQSVSSQCSSWNSQGACTACFKGYNLQNGACVLAPVQGPTDLGCAQWDWNNQVCLKCSNGFVFGSNGVCQSVSSQCSSWNSQGACTGCFKGYNLVNGACVLAPQNGPSDLGCAQWDWNNQVCLKCSNGFVFGSNGVCQSVSSQCSSWNSQGACTACYKGYNLVNGACALAPQNGPSDLGCAQWDWNNQVCLKCSNGFVFGSNGVCQSVSSQCSSWNSQGACTACFKGYNLVNGACTLAPVQGPSDLGCAQWDWNNQVCLKCSNGFVFGSNGVCQSVSSQCSSWNSQGACTGCYKGYNLVNGACVAAPVQGPTDPGCAQWNWDNQVCLSCSFRWVLSNGKCSPVSDNCQTYASSGSCTQCYPGYSVNNGACVASNPLCKSSNSNGTCSECYPQYVVNNGTCVPISSLANLYLYYSACCPEKLASLQAAAAASGN